MNKDEHERERQRWLIKMDEIEARLAESETLNSDMNQIKAELNKKIIELEKAQRPLIEQNRKLTDRNRSLTQEVKRLETKISHQMDDFLTLKDAHERLGKENSMLRRERTFPEKLEELDRYRSQVLEYSKCITALRQAGQEKDKRYEQLVQKAKKLRRSSRRVADEDDRHSTLGSDCSAESTMSLNTITEDLEESASKEELTQSYEALYRENKLLQKELQQRDQLQREHLQQRDHLQRELQQKELQQKELEEVRLGGSQPSFPDTQAGEEAALREQLSLAHATIDSQSKFIDGNHTRMELVSQYRLRITAQADIIRTQQDEIERLTRELADSQEQKDLLEFQCIEMRQAAEAERCARSNDDADNTDDDEPDDIIYPIPRWSYQEISQLKEDLKQMRNSNGLSRAYRDIARRSRVYIESIENQWIEHEATCCSDSSGDAKMVNAAQLLEEVRELSSELGEVRFQLRAKEDQLREEQDKLHELETRVQSESTAGDFEALQAEIGRQMEAVLALQSKLDNSQRRLVEVEKERDQIRGDLNVVRFECERLKNEQRPAIKTDLERRFEEARYRLNEALAKVERYETIIHAAREAEGGRASFSDELALELTEAKQYNDHLERQFKAQQEIIDVLKQRIVSNKISLDFLASLPKMGAGKLQLTMQEFIRNQRDEAARKTVNLVADIVELFTSDDGICDSVADIKKLHLRECRSADSTGTDSISNSEEVNSSGRHSDEEDWQRNHQYRSFNGVQQSLSTST